jgi:hypothetical protein
MAISCDERLKIRENTIDTPYERMLMPGRHDPQPACRSSPPPSIERSSKRLIYKANLSLRAGNVMLRVNTGTDGIPFLMD